MLRTALRLQTCSYTPHGSNELEAFLKDVETTLISDFESHFAGKPWHVAKNAEINKMSKLVTVPTNKTNSTRCIPQY